MSIVKFNFAINKEMMKATPTYSEGFKFIQISSLPFIQQLAFGEWINESSIQKLTINNIALTDCVAYEEYAYWFDFLYQKIGGLLDVSF